MRLEDRGLEQKGLDVRRLAHEDFCRQILAHEALAARERADEAGQVVAIAHRQRRQLQAGDPAFGALLERRDVARRMSGNRIISVRKLAASSAVKRRSAARSSFSCVARRAAGPAAAAGRRGWRSSDAAVGGR